MQGKMWGEPDLAAGTAVDDALKWMFSELGAIATKLFKSLQRVV